MDGLEKGIVSKTVFTLFVFLIFFFSAFVIAEDINAIMEVNDYIRWFHKNVSEKRTNRALTYAPTVVKFSDKYDLDPLLVSVFISFESSWKTSGIGKAKNEIGLMQVHGVAAKGFDLKTPESQIEAGTKHLRYAFDKCKTLERAIRAYATGKCRGSYNPASRIRAYRKAIKRHRKETK